MIILNTHLLILGNTVLDSTLRILQIVASIIVAISGIGLIAVQTQVLPHSLRTLREKQSQGIYVAWYNHYATLYSIGFLCFGAAMLLFSIGLFIGQANSTTGIIAISLLFIGLILLGFALFFVFRARRMVSKESTQQRRM